MLAWMYLCGYTVVCISRIGEHTHLLRELFVCWALYEVEQGNFRKAVRACSLAVRDMKSSNITCVRTLQDDCLVSKSQKST